MRGLGTPTPELAELSSEVVWGIGRLEIDVCSGRLRCASVVSVSNRRVELRSRSCVSRPPVGALRDRGKNAGEPSSSSSSSSRKLGFCMEYFPNRRTPGIRLFGRSSSESDSDSESSDNDNGGLSSLTLDDLWRIAREGLCRLADGIRPEKLGSLAVVGASEDSCPLTPCV